MKRTTLRHIMIKFLESSDKKKSLKAARENRHYFQRNKIRAAADFSLEMIQAIRQCSSDLKTTERVIPATQSSLCSDDLFQNEGSMEMLLDI